MVSRPSAVAGLVRRDQFRDDTGAVYRLRPPEDDPELALAEGEQLAGELAFVGPPAPEATSLRLFINADVDTDELQFTRPSPLDGPVSMVVEDLTVPGAGG